MINVKNIGESPARFSYYEQPGNVTLLDERRYCFLFVLQGRVVIQTPCHFETFESGTLAVVDKGQIATCTCTAGTSLLEFLPPSRIDRFFKSASRVFGTLASEHISYNDAMKEWIEQLHNDCLHGIHPDEYSYCLQLRHLLREYPAIVLGTLVIPLHACALTSEKCTLCKKRK